MPSTSQKRTSILKRLSFPRPFRKARATSPVSVLDDEVFVLPKHEEAQQVENLETFSSNIEEAEMLQGGHSLMDDLDAKDRAQESIQSCNSDIAGGSANIATIQENEEDVPALGPEQAADNTMTKNVTNQESEEKAANVVAHEETVDKEVTVAMKSSNDTCTTFAKTAGPDRPTRMSFK